jgi:GDP-mannose transporter
MVEDKKTDDYTVEMNKLDQGSKEFEAPPPQPRAAPPNLISNNPALPVLAYCGSSIMMTVMNKYVLSGLDFNLNFLLLMVQVCMIFSEYPGSVLIQIVRRLHCRDPNVQIHGPDHFP